MKKLFALLLVSGAMLTFTSCGPKKTEEATEESTEDTTMVEEETPVEAAPVDTTATTTDTTATDTTTAQ